MLQTRALRLLLGGFLLGVVLLGASCSGRKAVHAVTGKVLFEGRPAEGALVQFHPAEPSGSPPLIPQGHVGADGTFRLTTYRYEDGAPAGRYQVTVLWAVPSKGGDGYDKLLVPDRYLKPATSGLTATVPAEAIELPPFELTR
jgi:hypothetical protein